MVRLFPELIYIITALLIWAYGMPSAQASSLHPVQFEGLSPASLAQVRRAFPNASEGASLNEVDEILRFLMKTGNYSYVEAVASGDSIVVQTLALRKISNIKVVGNNKMSTSEVLALLDVQVGEVFERKKLQTGVDQISKHYGEAGYINAKADINFNTPNDKDVEIVVNMIEGPPCYIRGVDFESSNPELKNKLAKLSKSLIDQPLSNEAVTSFQNKVNEWLLKNRYLTARLSAPSVRLDQERVDARISLQVENPYTYEFIFTGNLYFSENELIQSLNLDSSATGAALVASPSIDMTEKIRKKYLEAGFAHINIETNEKSFDSLFKKEIRFQVKEGPRVRINAIEVSGAMSRPEKYYADFIRDHSTELISQHFYNREGIGTGVKNLVLELQNQGFLRAKSQSIRVEFSKDKELATVQVQIEEGSLTQLKQIVFDGNITIPNSVLIEQMSVKANSPLSLHDFEESLNKIKTYYKSQGYLEMSITNEKDPESLISYNDNNTQANVLLKIHEGAKVIVGSIVTQGNTFTKDFVILREIAFHVGDVLTPEKIDESIVRLQRLALFSRVNIRTLEEGQEISNRTVVIEVEERDPGVFSTGAGITNEHQLTYRTFGGFAYRNIGGTGRTLQGRLDLQYSSDPDISFLENKISLGYTEPYILGGRNRGRVNLIRKEEFWLQNPNGNVNPDGTLNSNGTVQIRDSNIVELLILRDLTRHLRLTYTVWRFANDLIFWRANNLTVLTQNIGKFGPLLEYDLRNDVFNPSRGSYSFGSVEYSDPLIGSSQDDTQLIKFVKFNAGYTHYTPIHNSTKYVWANAVRSGYVANISNAQQSGVPAIEAFFLGGRSTIRGYDPTDTNQIIPNYPQLGILPLDPNGLNDFHVLADSWYYLLKTEFRFPVYGAFGGAVFYDGGAVMVNQSISTNFVTANGDPYRHSVGVAVRIATPVGPVNLEIGFKLNRRQNPFDGSYEAPFAYHFSLGTF